MYRLLPATRRMIGLPLWPMLTRGTCASVVIVDRWKWLRHLAQNGKAGVIRGLSSRMGCPSSARRRAGSYGLLGRLLWQNWGTPTPCTPQEWDAKMPAYGLEDGGGVVA